MKTADTIQIEQSWPEDGVEPVQHCPFCGSSERAIAYQDVQDWSFYCAPGKWAYWDCKQCKAIYLNPRPTEATIGRAYEAYYTHSSVNNESILQLVKERIRNECWSHWINADVSPRLHLPKALGLLLKPLKSMLIEPFGLRELASLPKGALMDVGCGNGNMLRLATKLGWQTMGLEIDPAAVMTARNQGLDVLEGTYERLSEYSLSFDCIVCSHVLEHVHNPKNMLIKLKDALKRGGTLLLTLPNSTSALRYHFGENWRGLEAPRHLSIPSMHWLKASLVNMGFSVKQSERNVLPTALESSRIKRRAQTSNAYDKAVQKMLIADYTAGSEEQHDFVQFICLKK